MFVNSVDIRWEHKELIIQVGNRAICISMKYTIQMEPLYSEWDKFIPTSEKEFLDTLNGMLNPNSQQPPLNPNETSSM